MYTPSPERPPPHPAKAILVGRRITVRAFAKSLNMNHVWVGGVLNRRYPASVRFREQTAELLGMPEAELFHQDPKGLRTR